MTRRADPRLGLFVATAFLGAFAAVLVLGFVLGHPVLYGILAVMVGLLAATIVFGRRAQGAAYRQIEGQPGAAAGVLQSMRGNWRVTPAVAVTRNQDLVHRVVGRCGVVLVGEGASAAVARLIGQERRRLGPVLGDIPVHEVVVGDEGGRVPLRKLQTHFVKLPRALKPAQVNELDRRLAALQARTGTLPMPKGPLPKGARIPKGARTPRGPRR